MVGAALEAQAKLAPHAAGFHRLPHQDYLVAAIAAAHELGEVLDNVLDLLEDELRADGLSASSQ